ncbi:hypothetical protein AB0B13_33005 [Streptomyces sp. NPDC042898]|uniref:hypothetical protein n=1 Tax=Streptomyces sp. NPDC042898 TaxID=3154334 RepID=UPI0033EB77F4
MKILAGEWWESGSWWQFAITIAATLTVGFFAGWATLRAANPKRKIVWQVQSNTPLVDDQFNDGTVLAVQFMGYTLPKPRIVELVVANVGRRDITAAHFHGGAPLRFEFGAEVCMILNHSSEPAHAPVPTTDTASFDMTTAGYTTGTYVAIKPSLFRRGQVYTATVLINGDETDVTCTAAPFIDVDLDERRQTNAAGILAEGLRAGFLSAPLPSLFMWVRQR